MSEELPDGNQQQDTDQELPNIEEGPFKKDADSDLADSHNFEEFSTPKDTPLPQEVWTKAAQQAAKEFNRNNPPLPPLDTSVPKDLFEERQVPSKVNPNGLAKKPNDAAISELLDRAKDDDAFKQQQESWWDFIRGKKK